LRGVDPVHVAMPRGRIDGGRGEPCQGRNGRQDCGLFQQGFFIGIRGQFLTPANTRRLAGDPVPFRAWVRTPVTQTIDSPRSQHAAS
jgi:hypothetical protein